MPMKKKAEATLADTAALLQIPQELLDQFVKGPIDRRGD